MDFDTISRGALVDKWRKNHEDILDLCNKSGDTLPIFLNKLSPRAVEGYPEDAMGHLLAAENLAIRSKTDSCSATVNDFLDGGPKEALMWAQLDLDYDTCSSIHELSMKTASVDKKAAASSNTDAAQVDNSPFKPRSTSALYENRKFRPQVTIADLASGIETIPGTTFQIPKYDTMPADERPIIVAEGAPMMVTRLTTSTETGQTFKVGEGLATSNEFDLSNLRMQTVRTWVRRVAMRHEIYIVNRGINVLYEASGSGVNIGSSPNLASILRVALHFSDSESNGYAIDRLFALKQEAEEWIIASVESSDNKVPFNAPDGRFSGIFGGVQLMNGVQEPVRLGVVGPNSTDPNVGVNLVADDLLGLDSRFGLIFYRQQRGMMDESKYDPRSQVTERFLSQRVGWQLQDSNAVVKFRYA